MTHKHVSKGYRLFQHKEKPFPQRTLSSLVVRQISINDKYYSHCTQQSGGGLA